MKGEIHVTAGLGLFLVAATPSIAQSVPENWFTAKTVPSYLENIESIEVEFTSDQKWNREFIRWRDEIGHSLQLRHPDSQCTFRFMECPQGFLFDQTWESGGRVSRCEWGSYDGKHWHLFNRYNGLNHLEFSTRPNPRTVHGQVLSAPYPPFFEYLFVSGFPMPKKRFQDDIAVYNADWNELKSVPVWQAMMTRLIRPVEVVANEDGEPCWYLEVDGGKSPIGKAERARYQIWFPFESPVFPQRIELTHQESGEFIAVLEVKEFVEAPMTEGGKPFLFPSQWLELAYNCHDTEQGFPNLAYRTALYQLESLSFNQADESLISALPNGIRKIENLDTGAISSFPPKGE
ncbi:MAG: hypothetical protein AAGA96_00020 [Verrucomicrobiota bacterium]